MKTDRLSSFQIMTITVSAIFGVDIIIVPQRMAKLASQDGWISLAIGGMLTLLFGSIMFLLAYLYPDNDLPEIYIKLCGGFFGRIIMIPTTLHVLVYIAMSFRIFTQALLMFLLNRTPMYAIISLMLIVTAYSVYLGIHTIGSVIDLIFPVALITLIILLVTSMLQGNPDYLRPVLFENTDNVLKGIIPGLQEFTGYGIIAYIYSHSKKAKGTYKWYMLGIIIPVFFYLMITIICIMTFSAPGLVGILYPTLTLAKSIEFSEVFIERLEAFAAVIWISVVFASGIIFYYVSVRNISVLFGIKKKYLKYTILGHIPILLFLALFESNALVVLKQFTYAKMIQVGVAAIIVPFLIGYTLLKRRRLLKK